MNIIYLGDKNLNKGAKYLACIIKENKYYLDHVESNQKIPKNYLNKKYDLYIFSDYPSKNLSKKEQEIIIANIEKGSSLLMIGGWSSFTGRNGCYNKTLFRKILPVKLLNKDDRIHAFQGLALFPKTNHNILKNLPWSKPPLICGLNRVIAKKDSQTILEALPLNITKNSIGYKQKKFPALVIGNYKKGKIICYMSDVAPHWAGSMVDWGNKRLTLKYNAEIESEIGNHYFQFWTNIINFSK